MKRIIILIYKILNLYLSDCRNEKITNLMKELSEEIDKFKE